MFDDKEIEELCSEFSRLDGKMFFESDENINNLQSDFMGDVNINFLNICPNLRNNNVIFNNSAVKLSKPNTNTELDLLNKNFIGLGVSECDNYSENTMNGPDLGATGGNTDGAGFQFDKKGNEIDDEFKEIDEKLISPDIPVGNNLFHQNGWSPDTLGLWHSGPSSLNLGQTSNNISPLQDLTLSVTSNPHGPHSISGFSSSSKRAYSHQQLGAKVEMVYSLLSMLDTDNREDMSKTFLAMSSSVESCHAMRQSGCLPLLIQLIHSHELNKEVRKRAAEALHNIVHAQTDEKRRRREVRVLKLLEQVREYCDELRNDCSEETSQLQESEKHPICAIGTLMKFSFDAEHRQAICVLGGLHAVTQLLQVDHEAHGSTNDDSNCITLRRYAGMSLTNLTFGDGKNKALLCSFSKFMRALVDQLKSPSEDLRQVTASVLRNLSWRADSESKQALRNVGAVTALTVSAMEGKKESTLKSILSALWNLSAHCSLNKIDICSVPGALAFLVKMLRYKSSSNTLSIVENAGGILRNISSHIAVREDYRQILRDNNCFEVLLEQLKSPSLTVVSNACGTLWNLSARCPEDQKRLWEMGATTMLRSLVQSKHKMISMGSSAALKNLLTANPDENLLTHLDSTAKSLGLQNLPTLFVRKKKALEQELNITLAETCENIDPAGSPIHCDSSQGKTIPKRSESRDSVQSTQSDSVYERINQISLKNDEKVLENKNITLHDSLDEKSIPRKVEDQKLMRRYRSSMIPTPTFKKMNQDRVNEKTKEETVVEDRGNDKQKNKREIPVLNTRVRSKVCQMSDENISSRSNEINVDETCTQTSKKSPSCNETIYSKEQQQQEEIYQVLPSTVLRNENVPLVNTDFKEENCLDNITGEFRDKQIIEQSSCEEDALSDDSLNSSYDSRQTAESADKHPKMSESSGVKMTTAEENVSNLSEKSEKFKSRENSFTDQGNRSRDKNSSNVSSEISPNLSQRCLASSKLQEDDHQDQNEKSESTFFSPNGANEELNKSRIPKSSFKPAKTTLEGSNEFLNKEQESRSDDYKITNEIFPKFKVGSPVTNSSVLQIEANKICREIKKQQDFDMGCSLTSEVSLVSCSSFLDTGDYSLFDSTTDAIDFDDSENPLLEKSIFKIKNFPFRKPQTAESVSLPSLGSLKNDQFDALDLDNSVLSVASITSEIADTNSNNEAFNTYKKTDPELTEETIADLTLVSNENDTLNADMFDEDNSLHSQENLPLDTENLQFENTADAISKKLTPKEKRKTFQERYRTYTIRNVPNAELPTKDFVADIQSSNAEGGCNIQSNQWLGNNDCLNINQWKGETDKFDICSATFRKGNKYEKYYFSKSLDKEQYMAPNFVFDSRSLTDLLSIGPAERKELVDNAKLVAFSLKTAIQDGETISDSEPEEDHKSIEIDTATYSKSTRNRSFGKFSSPEIHYVEPYEEDTGEEDLEPKGARILKPNDKPNEKLEQSKVIRGRRKPLYVSPRKNSSRVSESPSNSPKISKVAIGTKKQLSEASSSPTLNREGTFTKDDIDMKKVEAKSSRTTTAHKNIETKGSNISRPINRNKSVPGGNTKRTGENQVSRIGRPVSAYSSKYERRAESDSSQKRPFSAGAGAGNKIGGSATSTKYTSGLASPKMKSSSSNQNIKAGSSSGSGFSAKPRNLTLQSSKSQSDASLNFVASKDKVSDTSGTEKTPKKEVTSKIASLWKKVEETKQRNQNVKDNRVWICPEKNTNAPEEILVVEKEEILDIPTRKIVHSFTCQALADEKSAPICTQETDLKSGREYMSSRDPEERRGKTEKRNIISAVIPPFNYNPPVSANVLPTKIKQVDKFHNGSLKVTTV